MRILHRDVQTLLQRVERLHVSTRLVFAAAIAAYGALHYSVWRELLPLGILFLLQLSSLGYCWYLSKTKSNRRVVRYGFATLFDLILVSMLTFFTGGLDSEFYLFYFVFAALAAYMLSKPASIGMVMLVALGYTASNWQAALILHPMEYVMRLLLLAFLVLAVNMVAEHTGRSETRLLKLFDTLNRRTTELEKVHIQLEMVYENSRILAGILDFDQIINQIIKIGERVLDYPALGIMLVGPGNNLIYRGRLIGGQKNMRLKAVTSATMELAYRVSRECEPVRVNDLANRSDYDPLLSSARSLMLVPMVTHGSTTGLLVAESPRPRAFTERDEHFLLILGRSAAMALENAILHRKTEELTIIDELTGVHNYRYFAAKIEEEKKRAVRYQQPLSLIMLDIDWFKRFNDSFGHEIGNQVLVGLVGVIRRCIRDVDVLCRYGGEEFIIILPNTTEREAHNIAERMRVEIEGARFGGQNNVPLLHVTVSVGITSYPENGLSEEELINAVDQAMYRAKGSGKNTVCTV